MFDIGFSEILLIFGLALIVLGPEKLPRVASQVGRWIGRARGMARQFREQLEEEVNLEEARKSRPAAIAHSAPPETLPPAVIAPPSPAIEAPSAPISPDTHAESSRSLTGPGDVAASATPPPSYPDHYSHAHPTDAEGRPLPPPPPAPDSSSASETGTPRQGSASESGQHDWVGSVTPDKPAQGTPAAGYAPPHERGT